MAKESLELIDPTVALEDSFRAMVAEYAAAGEDRYQGIPPAAGGGFAAYVRKLRDGALGVDLPPNHVPGNTYWMVQNGRRVVGASRLRHWLNEALRNEGGHIGYDVRPSDRRKGYGTRLLALTLDKARARGITRVLVTCTTDNVASARIIERTGGVFESEIMSSHFGKPLSRYWIDL